MTPEHKHIAGLELALDEMQRRGISLGQRACLHELIAQAKAAPEPVQGEAVEVVAWRTNRNEDSTFPRLHRDESEAQSWVIYCNNGPRITKEPLMAVAQHRRIMAALQQPDVHVQVTGSLDEIDAPVWPFINAEALKVGAEKGRIETYRYERANGGVAVLWDANNVHAMAVTIRDDMNRTRCVRITAAAKPDAEPTTKDRLAVAEPDADLTAILIDAQMAVQDMQEVHDDQADWASAGAMVGLNDRIDAKLAELRKGES